MNRYFGWLASILVVFSVLPKPAHASDPHYFQILFAYQGTPNEGRSSHTFGAFLMVQDGVLVQESTVSWLPAEGYFGPDYQMPPLRRVPGHNYTLDETLQISIGKDLQYWGPYEITAAHYNQAMRRVEYLNAAETDYKMVVLDPLLRRPALNNEPGGAINCIIAVSDIGGYLDTGTAWGFSATQRVLDFFRPQLPSYPTAHDEVSGLMHLADRLSATGHSPGNRSLVPQELQ